MRRNPTHLLVTAAALVLGLAAVALAGDQDADTPFRSSYQLRHDSPNHARLVYPAQRHPEVAVSRSLAAQPVHPWKAKVVLNNTMSTYIDPAQDLTTSSGLHLDENHSLVKAQRRHNQLSGVTTSQMNQRRNQREAARSSSSKANRAKTVYPNRSSRARGDNGRSAGSNRARVVRPNRGRPQQRRPQRVDPAPRVPEQNRPSPASEPAPERERDRQSVPIPSVPRQKERPDGKVASSERP